MYRLPVISRIVLFVLILKHIVLAQPVIQAVFISEEMQIDGVLDEAAWQKAAVVDQFFQREPNPGAPATEKTRVYIFYDKNNIYFGFRCDHQDPDDITAKEMARDVSLGNDDRVQIILDTFLDQRTGYWFQIGPRGSIGDALVSENGAGFNKSWDCLFDGRARIRDRGWDAEVAIPFKSMSFRSDATQWGLKLIRHIKKKSESAYWPMGNVDTYRFQISDAGILDGIRNISRGIGFDIIPYGLLGFDQKIGTSTKFKRDTGVDLFYRITPGLKSALTVNTDFAQTEVDSRQINLTRFPLFYPEKRDFFLDGANYFTFGLSGNDEGVSSQKLIPFFTRRVGLDSLGNPIPIIWGAKVTGQIGRWNIGLMNIRDEGNGTNRNLSVARIKRDFGSQSSFGMIATSGNALNENNNNVIGIDLKIASSAFQGNKNIAAQVYALKSTTDNLTGHNKALGWEFAFPNDLISVRLGMMQIEKNFRAGIGFVRRYDVRESYLSTTIGPRTQKFGLLQVLFASTVDYITDLENRLLTRGISVTPLKLRFKSGDEFSVTGQSEYEFLSRRFNIHKDHIIPVGKYEFNWYQIAFQSAQHRNVWTTLAVAWGGFYNGSRRDLQGAIGYKVSVPLYVGLELERNNVSLVKGHFSTTVSRFNMNILFSPNVTLYNFIQYDNLSKKMGWQSRFQWILTPGNEIHLTWHSRWEDPLERHQVTESAPRLKINYTYRL